jgi:hypothetical protein
MGATVVDIDLNHLKAIAAGNDRYEQQLNRLTHAHKQTSCIEAAVTKAALNVLSGESRSFVIYGEPQSGKTEMMICLTAKLLDNGYNVIVHLLNDSVQLLQQNLDRFQRAGLAPAAKNFADFLDPEIRLTAGQHVIFCKKNAKDLDRLCDKVMMLKDIVVIDDEADFATPNARINSGEITRINELVGRLIGKDGTYIGVTATPARLDLNNTFDNNNEKWVDFPTHSEYTGQADFFPIETPFNFRLKLLSDDGDGPHFIREALFRFLATVAYINLNSPSHENYSMLIHTSGKKVDHKLDKKPIDDVFQALSDVNSNKFAEYARAIRTEARNIFGEQDADSILNFVIKYRTQYNIIVMNSERDKNIDFKSATSPSALFTVIIGGNIVSRGVTFDNLISMYFSRDAKHKIQQDTYIQRARMFGSRKPYLRHFELTIPNSLYVDWHRCFVFHKLALEAIRAGLGSPVWLGDSRIATVSPSSIDRANVSLDRGEMTFPPFTYDPALPALIASSAPRMAVLKQLQARIGAEALPDYLLSYVERTLVHGDKSIAIHSPAPIEGYKDANHAKIERQKGLFGKSQREKFPNATHHFLFYFNSAGSARIVYSFVGNITFIKNLKNAA